MNKLQSPPRPKKRNRANRTFICWILLGFVFCQARADVTEYVDPRIGNISKLLVPTFPTFHLPNQMIRMIPGRHEYRDDQIDNFPLQIYSHRFPGIFRMKPGTGQVNSESWAKKMMFDHDLEVMHPWFYSTYLLDENISVSFTPGKKCAIYKIEFPAEAQKYILINGTRKMKAAPADGNKISMTETIKSRLRGEPTTPTMNAYCSIQLTDESGAPLQGVHIQTDAGKLQFTWSKNGPQTILLKYAISYIDGEQAQKNFQNELSGKQFDDVASSGKQIWTDALSKIQVTGGTEQQKRSFYTALYRTFERMVDINEDGRYYSGYDKKIHKSDRPFYVDDWVWDTYLAHHPLRTIIDPDKENDMLNSYVLMYQQSGALPTFPLLTGNSRCMFAYHSCAIFLDAYRKGLRDYDIEKAYEGIKKNLTEFTAIPWRQGLPNHELDEFYHKHGFYPALPLGRSESYVLVDPFERRQAVAITLGMSYDAWVAAELAKTLNHPEDYHLFARDAKNYTKLWNPEQQLFMPRDRQGKWLEINPKLDGGSGFRDYYDENNGWTYAWCVQHDIDGLIHLLGGKEAAEARLDQVFREDLEVSRRDYFVDGSNATGITGQFAMGNEPAFHIPYLYNYFGAPWKTQRRVRFLLDVWFQDTYHGIPGDEDGGGMSAFVVLSSIGIYQVTPGRPVYTLTSPVFETVTINLKNGKTFTIKAPGASKQNKYIQKVFLNDQELKTPFITHDQIIQGGTLLFNLGKLPNKEWGTGSRSAVQ